MNKYTASDSCEQKKTSEEEKNSAPELPKTDFLDRFLYLIFIPSFLALLVLFDLVQRIFRIFGSRIHARTLVILNTAIVYAHRIILGTRVEISFEEPLLANTPYIAVSNHQSIFDIAFLLCYLGSNYPRFIAKKELARWVPSASYYLRHGGNALIDRSNPKQAIAEITKLGQRLSKERFLAVIFPEGTRARTGEMKKFRLSGLITLLSAAPDAKVVPITIDGSWKLTTYSRGPIPRNTTVRILVGKPINREGIHSNRDLAEKVYNTISESLSTMRVSIQ